MKRIEVGALRPNTGDRFERQPSRLPAMNRIAILGILFVCFALAGCASTKVETSGSRLKESLCQTGAGPSSVLVYWGPQWRPDQKEPALREAAALRGIQDFFASSPCIVKADIRRLPGEPATAESSDEQIQRLAAAEVLVPDRVVLIVVRELGPKLRIGLPVLVEGSTEVVVEVRVLDGRRSESMANVRTHWENGGTFVIKGVETLDQDMSAALRASLCSAAASQ